MTSLLSATLLSAALLGHPNHHEDRLLYHFAVGTHPIRNATWDDVSHQAQATLVGRPGIEHRGPTECLRLHAEDRLLVSRTSDHARPIQPLREFSIAAWLSVDSTSRAKAIVGSVQVQGDPSRGWTLGTDGKHFTFGLATASGDPNGNWTSFAAATPIRLGGWHYVVATYDGAAMRLYVDGKPSGESHVRSGDILISDQTAAVLSLDGALFEIKAYARVLSGEEIARVAEKNDNLLAWQPAPEGDLQFLVQPLLQFGTRDSMTVVCETSRPTTMTVQFGETIPLIEAESTSQPSLISELTLPGLKTHTRYFYRVVCSDETGKEIQSELYSLQTAPPAEQPWAFAVIGDTQRNPEVTRRCAEGAFALRPNFLLHCGDVVDDGFAKNQWLKDLFEPCAKLMANIPTFPVIGNHEKDSHWYYDYFSLPKPEYWYTFHYGNAQFFMLDTNRPLAPGSEQFQWLEKELAASTAPWKFAAHHHPCFSSDEDDYGDHVKGSPKREFTYGYPNAQHAIPLHEKYGVDIVFNGHIHVYERTWPIFRMSVNREKGIRYITSGGGGGRLETPAPQRTWFSLHVNKAYHYCQAAIHDRTIVFQAYDIEGRMFDAFELTKGEQPSSGDQAKHADPVPSSAIGRLLPSTRLPSP